MEVCYVALSCPKEEKGKKSPKETMGARQGQETANLSQIQTSEDKHES